jgi:hypothetical protein
VHLSVRYETAADFVREYADNLSRGGLFIARGRGLSRHRDVMVELELPGFGAYQVRAEVVHVVSPEMAAANGHAAGAGLAIREAPDGFADALASYLERIERRAAALVLAAGPAVHLLSAAGYQVEEVASPAALAAAIAGPTDGGARLVGAAVPAAALDSFRVAAGARAELVVALDGSREIDEVLAELDRRL